jgi:hypothetical protein
VLRGSFRRHSSPERHPYLRERSPASLIGSGFNFLLSGSIVPATTPQAVFDERSRHQLLCCFFLLLLGSSGVISLFRSVNNAHQRE